MPMFTEWKTCMSLLILQWFFNLVRQAFYQSFFVANDSVSEAWTVASFCFLFRPSVLCWRVPLLLLKNFNHWLLSSRLRFGQTNSSTFILRLDSRIKRNSWFYQWFDTCTVLPTTVQQNFTYSRTNISTYEFSPRGWSKRNSGTWKTKSQRRW